MTMPLSDEQLSRELSTLKEAVVDFRNEMRAAMTGVVRQDVYQAQQETLRAQVRGEIEVMGREIAALRAKIETMEAEKRQKNGIVWGALASGALSLVMSVLSLNK
jgi:hypothetical protein